MLQNQYIPVLRVRSSIAGKDTAGAQIYTSLGICNGEKYIKFVLN